MAKMKTYAVDVEITLRRTLIVEARKPGGAEAKVMSPAGWDEATRWDDDDAVRFADVARDVKVVRIREA